MSIPKSIMNENKIENIDEIEIKNIIKNNLIISKFIDLKWSSCMNEKKSIVCISNIVNEFALKSFFNMKLENILEYGNNIITNHEFSLNINLNKLLIKQLNITYKIMLIVYNINYIDEHLLDNKYFLQEIEKISDKQSQMPLFFKYLNNNKISKIPLHLLYDNKYSLSYDQITILAGHLSHREKIQLISVHSSNNLYADYNNVLIMININICIEKCTFSERQLLLNECNNFIKKIKEYTLNKLNLIEDKINSFVTIINQLEPKELDICTIIKKYYSYVGIKLIKLRKLSWNHKNFINIMLKYFTENEIKNILDLTPYYFTESNLNTLIKYKYYTLVESFINNKIELKEGMLNHLYNHSDINNKNVQQIINFFESSRKINDGKLAGYLIEHGYKVKASEKSIDVIIAKIKNNKMLTSIKNNDDFNRTLLEIYDTNILEKFMKQYKMYKLNSITKGHVLAHSQKKYFTTRCEGIKTTFATVKEFANCINDDNKKSLRLLHALILDK